MIDFKLSVYKQTIENGLSVSAIRSRYQTTGWRIPTNTEWYNVDNTGGWTNWNGPWGSGLKMHAAGDLYWGNGSPEYRGSNAYYWGSTQYDAAYGWFLSFYSGGSYMNGSFKANGFSVRCVRDF